MANLWRRFRALPMVAQLPAGIVAGLVVFAIVSASSADPDDGQDLAATATSAAPASTLGTPTTQAPRSTAPAVPLPAGEDTIVKRVTDGDSIVVGDGTRIRLIGVDTPEVESDDCHSAEATAHTTELVGAGTKVRLVYDAGRLDSYGRTLAYVYRLPDGLFVNLALARDGFARQLTVAPNVRHADEIGAAVADARRANRGLWSSCLTTTSAPAATTRAPSAAAALIPELGDAERTTTGDATARASNTDETLSDGSTTDDSTTDDSTTDEAATDIPTGDEPAGGCHSSYAGACVPIASDVDCGGGQGNGPAYVYENDFQVVGPDVYGLDGDGDRVACEG